MLKLFRAALAALIALHAPPLLAAVGGDTLVLQPVGPWRVDYSPDECRLLRTFGTGADAVVLRIARGGKWHSYNTIIAGTSVPELPRSVQVTLALEPQGLRATQRGNSEHVPQSKSRFVRWFDENLDVLNRSTPDQNLRVSVDERYTVRLHLMELPGALAALDTCYADFLKSKGIEPANIVGVARRIRPLVPATITVTAIRIRVPSGQPPPILNWLVDRSEWITGSDYPTEVLRQEIGGVVTTALTVGSDGRVASCRVTKSSGSASLDNLSCDLLVLRARYEPARNTEGTTLAAETTMQVRWVVPRD